MEVPGYKRAARSFSRRFAKEVSEGAKKQSIIMKFCRQVTLLYGSTHSSYLDGQLGVSRGLSEFSHDYELPLAEFTDPEGMLLRRWQISACIVALSGDDQVEDES
jgi:hypothetical protein